MKAKLILGTGLIAVSLAVAGLAEAWEVRDREPGSLHKSSKKPDVVCTAFLAKWAGDQKAKGASVNFIRLSLEASVFQSMAVDEEAGKVYIEGYLVGEAKEVDQIPRLESIKFDEPSICKQPNGGNWKIVPFRLK